MMKFIWPLVLFVVLAVFLAVGLNRDPREVPSPLIDKPAPAFKTVLLSDPAKSIARDDLKGQVWLLNPNGVFAYSGTILAKR